ncbi:hypothetical protein [Amycolatopsis sp. H20-H5]|uniref:hypothetical protein n=1 Tax=Amycolatopsis sp. H20-H5 TaxID=3046309 RepID=UPI002DBFD5B1|nr:hypothetical protein [Amycolatopsis sp. H20-H5]MEC3976871.1 hypothetical protein [Amycolatopsis sp. H20-H5]
MPTRLPLALGLCLVLAGCTANSGTGPAVSSSATPPPPSTSASPELAIQWVDGYCQAVNDFRKDHNEVLNSTSGDSPKAFAKQLVPYTAVLTKAIDRLNALPAAPAPAGETAKKTFLDNYTAARDKVTSAKAKLDAAKNSTAAQNKAVDTMIEAQKLAMRAYDPVGAIMTSPELSDASARATHCTEP